MKRLFIFLMACIISTGLASQTNNNALLYAKSINVNNIRRHIAVLSSDSVEGRRTGEPGAKKAAGYIAAAYGCAGLKAPVNGSWFMDVPIVKTEFYVTGFSVNNHHFKFNKSFFVNDSYASGAIRSRNVIFVGYGTNSEIENIDLNQKVLLWINEDKPMAGDAGNTSGRFSDNRKLILHKLESKHPAIILAINADVPGVLIRYRKSVTGPRLSISADLAGKVPIFLADTVIAGAISKTGDKYYADLKQEASHDNFRAYSIGARFEASYNTNITNIDAANVLGLIPGGDLKDELLVLSAHYDHLGLNDTGADRINNGADDNASGIAAILEIAAAFSEAQKHGHGPRRSVLFLATVAEEEQLLGSAYYCDHPLKPLINTVADLNVDMIGRTGSEYLGKPDSANYVYSIGSARHGTELRAINENVNNLYTKLKIDYTYDAPDDSNRFYYRSDQYSFASKGVPVIFYFNGLHADYHQPSDEVDKINCNLLVKRAELIFYTAWELATREKRPTVDAQFN